MVIICEFTNLGRALNDVIYGVWIQILLVHSNQLFVHFVHVFSDFTRETPPWLKLQATVSQNYGLLIFTDGIIWAWVVVKSLLMLFDNIFFMPPETHLRLLLELWLRLTLGLSSQEMIKLTLLIRFISHWLSKFQRRPQYFLWCQGWGNWWSITFSTLVDWTTWAFIINVLHILQ